MKNKVETPKSITSPLARSSATPNFMRSFAEEVAKVVIARLPRLPKRTRKTPKKKKDALNGIFLDTSAIIDERIIEAGIIGIFGCPVVILDSVLLELKHIADGKEERKREQGRRALNLLNNLKKTKGIKFLVLPVDSTIKEKHKEVDEQLIALSRMYKGHLVTCDYNLEQKAKVHGIVTINVHVLARAFRTGAKAGEEVEIKIMHEGKESTQGVGYLDDGTMVVVENGKKHIGETVKVIVSKILQTPSGKILFAKMI